MLSCGQLRDRSEDVLDVGIFQVKRDRLAGKLALGLGDRLGRYLPAAPERGEPRPPGREPPPPPRRALLARRGLRSSRFEWAPDEAGLGRPRLESGGRGRRGRPVASGRGRGRRDDRARQRAPGKPGRRSGVFASTGFASAGCVEVGWMRPAPLSAVSSTGFSEGPVSAGFRSAVDTDGAAIGEPPRSSDSARSPLRRDATGEAFSGTALREPLRRSRLDRRRERRRGSRDRRRLRRFCRRRPRDARRPGTGHGHRLGEIHDDASHEFRCGLKLRNANARDEATLDGPPSA